MVMQPQHLGLALGQRQGAGKDLWGAGRDLTALAELLPVPSLMLEGFGAENQTVLAVLRLALGLGVSPPQVTIWGSDCLQPCHLHGILPEVIFVTECLIAEVSSGTRRAVCGLSLLLLSLSSHFSAFTSLQDELADQGLTAHPAHCCSPLWLQMLMGFWGRADEVWVPFPALLPPAQHQSTPP